MDPAVGPGLYQIVSRLPFCSLKLQQRPLPELNCPLPPLNVQKNSRAMNLTAIGWVVHEVLAPDSALPVSTSTISSCISMFPPFTPRHRRSTSLKSQTLSWRITYGMSNPSLPQSVHGKSNQVIKQPLCGARRVARDTRSREPLPRVCKARPWAGCSALAGRQWPCLRTRACHWARTHRACSLPLSLLHQFASCPMFSLCKSSSSSIYPVPEALV